jgi:hypothetical protein
MSQKRGKSAIFIAYRRPPFCDISNAGFSPRKNKKIGIKEQSFSPRKIKIKK